MRTVGLRRSLQPEAGHAGRPDLATVPRHSGHPSALPATETYEAIDLARSVYRYLAPLDYPTDLPQVVHASAAAFCAIPAVVLRERWGVPFLLTEHGVYYRERLLALGRNRTNSPYRVFLSNFYAAVVAMAYSRADLVSPVARFNATWETRLGVDEAKIHPMPNGVDPERFPLTRPAGSGTAP